MSKTKWSYSSITTFEKCPKRYYHEKVACDVERTTNFAATYGVNVHEAAEHYLRDGVPIPEKYGYMIPIVDAIKNKDGEVFAEMELAIAKDGDTFRTTEFNADDVWYRGIADACVVNCNKALLIDYKTGKNARYADERQLTMMAAALFLKYPDLEDISAALLYVVSDEVVKRFYKRVSLEYYLATFDPLLTRLEVAHSSGVWNAAPSGLCPYCSVKSCAHYPN
jgi:hypothetical protein